MQEDAVLVSHNFFGEKNQAENKYVTKIAKMSMVMNEGVDIHCKGVMTQLITVLIVELGTSIEKSKGYFDSSYSII